MILASQVWLLCPRYHEMPLQNVALQRMCLNIRNRSLENSPVLHEKPLICLAAAIAASNCFTAYAANIHVQGGGFVDKGNHIVRLADSHLPIMRVEFSIRVVLHANPSLQYARKTAE